MQLLHLNRHCQTVENCDVLRSSLLFFDAASRLAVPLRRLISSCSKHLWPCRLRDQNASDIEVTVLTSLHGTGFCGIHAVVT